MQEAERVYTALMTLAPETMRGIFAPMVEMAISQLPAETLSALATDLQNAVGADGEVDFPKLVAVGKQFGLTDEMIAGYQNSFAASA